MRNLILVILCSLSFLGFSQKIKFKVANQKDTTVFLVKYYGKGMYYADTAIMKNGNVEFDGSKQKPGVLALLLPGVKYFDFIYNNEEVILETSSPDFIPNMLVKKSEENKLFIPYMQFITKNRKAVNELLKKRETIQNKEDAEYIKLTTEIDAISESVIKYQEDLVTKNSAKLVGKIVKMSMDIKIPEAPKNEKGQVIDSNFAYNYYRDHYFDNVDLKDDRIINGPIFYNKLDEYFGKKMLIQHPDTIVKYGILFLDKLDPKSEMFKYCLTHITSNAEKSNIMGMDKVFVRMGQKYYCVKNSEGKSPAYWMPEDKLKELCEKVNTNKNLVQGVIPPNIILRDSTDVKWHDFYSLKNEYTILYFWDPGCGHCKTSTPKLEKLYAEKLKKRNIDVFAVGKATGEDFEKWKKFIRDNKLTFINVGLTDKLFNEAQDQAKLMELLKITTIQSLNYQETYDIVSTPRVFILDKDKKIVGKQLSIAQLEDYLDKLQDYKGPKIIEPDPEDKEEKQTH